MDTPFSPPMFFFPHKCSVDWMLCYWVTVVSQEQPFTKTSSSSAHAFILSHLKTCQHAWWYNVWCLQQSKSVFVLGQFSKRQPFTFCISQVCMLVKITLQFSHHIQCHLGLSACIPWTAVAHSSSMSPKSV